MINGRLCDKWQGTYDQGANTLWLDLKLHIPTYYTLHATLATGVNNRVETLLAPILLLCGSLLVERKLRCLFSPHPRRGGRSTMGHGDPS